MNVVSVKVNGIVYNLKGEEQTEYLQKVANYADRKIREIMNRNSVLDTSSASVLSAINIVDELFKAQFECRELSGCKKMYEEELAELKNQIEHLEQTNSELMQRLEHSIEEDLLNKKEAELGRLKSELALIEETAQKYVEKNNQLKAENKEVKFHLQTSKYKFLDLQNKLMETQIDYAKEKKLNSIPAK
ncbi:MAG: cell division protein ZapA [Clostridiaceae bacterium]